MVQCISLIGKFSDLVIAMQMDSSDHMKKVGVPTSSFLSSYNVSRLFESEDKYFSQTDIELAGNDNENLKYIMKVKFCQIR